MDLYGALIRRVLYPAWESGVRRRPTLERVRYLEATQWKSLDELVAIQARELAALVRHAHAHVPHYRAVMDAAGVGPDAIRGPADLARLPLLSRAAAKDSQDARRSTAPPLPTIKKTTGGTTGEPLTIRYDTDSEYWRQAVKQRGFGWSGFRLGDPSLHFWGEATARPSFGQRAKASIDHALKRETYVDCNRRGDAELAAVVARLRRRPPRALFCYAQAGAELARYVNRTGARDWGTIAVVCGAERVMPADRAALEQAFGPAVFETYGCREVMLIGAECAEHDGLHLSMENLIVELCDDDGRPVAPGEIGRVVLTDLHNYGQPFIRYANGDLALARAPGPCACGRHLTRLGAVEGRSTETLRDGRGQAIGGMVFNLTFSPLADAVRQFQAVQHADRSITVKVVPVGAGLPPAAVTHFEANCARYLPGIAVRLELVPAIALSKSGKRSVVVVEPAAE